MYVQGRGSVEASRHELHTSSASPASTKGFASDHRKIRMSPFFPFILPSSSIPRPCTKQSLRRRMKTAVSRSGVSIMLMLPAVSFRFCRFGGKDDKNEER